MSMDSIGAFWKNTSQKTGKTYYSGNITIDGRKVDLIMYVNDYKNGDDRKPEFKIFPKISYGQQGDNRQAEQRELPQQEWPPGSGKHFDKPLSDQDQKAIDDFEDDIPF